MTAQQVWHFVGFRIVRVRMPNGSDAFTLYRRRHDPDPWQEPWVWSGTYDTYDDAVRDMRRLSC